MEFIKIREEYKPKNFDDIQIGDIFWSVNEGFILIDEIYASFYSRRACKGRNKNFNRCTIVKYNAVAGAILPRDLIYIPLDKISIVDLGEVIKIAEKLEKTKSTRKIGENLVIKFRKKYHEDSSIK